MARGLHPVRSDDDVEVGGGSLGWQRRLSVSRRNRRLADLTESAAANTEGPGDAIEGERGRARASEGDKTKGAVASFRLHKKY